MWSPSNGIQKHALARAAVWIHKCTEQHPADVKHLRTQMEAQFRSHSFAVYVLSMLPHNFELQPITSVSVCKMKGAIQHPQSDRLNLDVFEDCTVIVWASHMALGLSLSTFCQTNLLGCYLCTFSCADRPPGMSLLVAPFLVSFERAPHSCLQARDHASSISTPASGGMVSETASSQKDQGAASVRLDTP